MEKVINKKRIGIDARFYGPTRKGLGRYTQEVVDRVVAMDKENDYVIFLSHDNFDNFKYGSSNVKKVLADIRWYTLAEQIVFPWLIKKEKLDLMHFPHFNVPLYCSTNFIVTIHDLILTKFPTVRATTLNPVFYWFKNFAYRIVINNAVRRAKKIIAVSQFTKDDLIKQFKVSEDKIVVTYLGIAQTFIAERNDEDVNVLKKYEIKNSYLLYVGNAYPHKNLEGLIKLFSRIKEVKGDLQLVLVGKDDYFYERVKVFAKQYNTAGKDIVFPGFPSDNDLVYFYRHALAYVFPSKYEGFGLPPLEAMSQGCPVASSNQASMPEIFGDAAIYFNPDNEDEMVEQILKVMNDIELRNILIARGRERVKKYDWNKCAKQTLEIYNNLI